MKKLVPFNVWFSDIQELIESINKTNFEVLENIGSYKFGSIKHERINTNLYSFSSTKDASLYNPPTIPSQSNTIAGTITGPFTVALPSYTGMIQTLEKYTVQIVCSNERILKIEVIEDYRGSFSEQRTVHCIVFHDKDILANGEWYNLDSPDAFINDINNEEISILAIIDLLEKFKK